MAKHAKRASNFFCSLSYYYYTHDEKGNVVNNVSEDAWKVIIETQFQNLLQSGDFNFFVWIFHGKDIDSNGNPKGLHVHFIANYKKGVEQTVVMQQFGITRAKDADFIRNKPGAFQYLIHITPDALKAKKHIYDFSEIKWIAEDMTKCNRDWLMKQFYPTKSSVEDKEFMDEIYRKILIGEMVPNEAKKLVIEKFGASKWTTEKKKVDNMVLDWMYEVNTWYSTHNSCKVTIFITGGGGSQKTDLAQMVIAPTYADGRGVHVPSSPMGRITYDPVGTYRGQKVSVLNEITGDAWILEGFCETLDPTHSSVTGSRFSDKPFFPDVVCMTTSDSLENFILKMFLKWLDNRTKGHWEVCGSGANQFLMDSVDTRHRIPYSTDTVAVWNKVWQIRRRIPIVVTLHDGMASIDLLDYSKEFYYINNTNNDGYVHFADVQYSLTDDNIKKLFLSTLSAGIDKYFEINNFSITPNTVQRPILTL